MNILAGLPSRLPNQFAQWISGILVLVSMLSVPAVCAQPNRIESIELLLQNPLEFDNPADRCQAEICLRLIALLEGAAQSIEFAIYGARHQSEVLDALIRARDRGVRVRGYVDRNRDGDNIYESTDNWVSRIGNVRDDQSCIPTSVEYTQSPKCPRPQGFEGPLQCSAYELGDHLLLARHASRGAITSNPLMHNKFFVVDGEWVWTGSANISDSGIGGYNANAVFVIRSKGIAATYIQEFQHLWNRTGSDCSKLPDGIETFRIRTDSITTWFSPQDNASRYGVSGLIARATKQINVAVFFLTSKYLAADLMAAHLRGVRVRVITDATAAKNGYSKHELLREAGIPVKIENWGGKMHMKTASIDGQYLAAGSMNWTSAGERINDENTLLIRSSRLASQFDAYFHELWESIPDRWAQPHARPDPESRDSGTSCFDGVDNDFDGTADDNDPGCSDNPPPLPDLPPHEIVFFTLGHQTESSYRFVNPTRCDASYPDWFVCLPERPFVACKQLPYRRFRVVPPDPQSKDRDRDGIGCESTLMTPKDGSD